jgi:hypothetical protein
MYEYLKYIPNLKEAALLHRSERLIETYLRAGRTSNFSLEESITALCESSIAKYLLEHGRRCSFHLQRHLQLHIKNELSNETQYSEQN